MQKHDDVRARRQEQTWMVLKTRSAEVLKHMIEQLMLQARTSHCACAPRQRSTARRAYRNGFYTRRLDTTCGPLKLRVPRVRGAVQPLDLPVLEHYRRRQPHVDRAVMRWAASGLSTRQVCRTLIECFGTVVSPATVSAIVARLDRRIRTFHRRPLPHGYRYLHLDAKHWYRSHLRTRPGRGRKKKAVLLLAWGVRHNGAEELVDFRVADSESEANWTDFLTDLEARGVRRRNPWNQTLDMIVSDADAGLRAALWMVYPRVPKQLCVFHKLQSLTGHLRERAHRGALLAEAGAIYDDLGNHRQARRRLARWAARWRQREPDAVRRLEADFEDTLTYLNAPAQHRRRLKTNNPIERFIRELNRKTKQVGIYPSAASWERATYMVWEKLRTDRYAPTRPRNPQSLSTQSS